MIFSAIATAWFMLAHSGGWRTRLKSFRLAFPTISGIG